MSNTQIAKSTVVSEYEYCFYAFNYQLLINAKPRA